VLPFCSSHRSVVACVFRMKGKARAIRFSAGSEPPGHILGDIQGRRGGHAACPKNLHNLNVPPDSTTKRDAAVVVGVVHVEVELGNGVEKRMPHGKLNSSLSRSQVVVEGQMRPRRETRERLTKAAASRKSTDPIIKIAGETRIRYLTRTTRNHTSNTSPLLPRLAT